MTKTREETPRFSSQRPTNEIRPTRKFARLANRESFRFGGKFRLHPVRLFFFSVVASISLLLKGCRAEFIVAKKRISFLERKSSTNERSEEMPRKIRRVSADERSGRTAGTVELSGNSTTRIRRCSRTGLTEMDSISTLSHFSSRLQIVDEEGRADFDQLNEFEQISLHSLDRTSMCRRTPKQSNSDENYCTINLANRSMRSVSRSTKRDERAVRRSFFFQSEVFNEHRNCLTNGTNNRRNVKRSSFISRKSKEIQINSPKRNSSIFA